MVSLIENVTNFLSEVGWYLEVQILLYWERNEFFLSDVG